MAMASEARRVWQLRELQLVTARSKSWYEKSLVDPLGVTVRHTSDIVTYSSLFGVGLIQGSPGFLWYKLLGIAAELLKKLLDNPLSSALQLLDLSSLNDQIEG